MKRAIWLIIVLSLLLPGCANRAAAPSADTPSLIISDNPLSVNDAENTRQATTGRFVETDITPPNTEPFAMWLTNEGIVCQVGPKDLLQSLDDGITWSAVDTGWMSSFDHAAAGICHVEADGTIWVQADDPVLPAELWRNPPDGNLQKIHLDGVDNYISVKVESTFPDNRLLARYGEAVPGIDGWEDRSGVFDGASGELLYSITPPEQYFRIMGTDFFSVNDDSIFYIAPGGRALSDLNATIYQISDGAQVGGYMGIVPVQGLTAIEFEISDIATDQDNLYYINHLGLNRVALGGSLSEVIIETERYQFQGGGIRASKLLIGPDDTFFVLSGPDRDNPDKPSRVYKYVFDPNAPYQEPTTKSHAATYFVERDFETNTGVLIKQSPNAEPVKVADDINNIKAENDYVIVFTRNKILEPQKQPATETLHYFDKATGTVTDIFTDSWIEYTDVRATSGRVLGVWVDGGEAKPWVMENPDFVFIKGKLKVYISRIEDRETDVYFYDFTANRLDLQDTLAWDTLLQK